MSTRHVLRDGAVVAVLRTLDGGLKVVAELFGRAPTAPRASASVAYTFRDRFEASAFVDDALGTFAYIGCEIRASAT